VVAPPLIVQARTAIGKLKIPAGTLSFQPANETLVGVPTSLWVTGVSAQTLTGSSAFGLVAIATPDHLVMDPGDGTGARTCPWVTAAATAQSSCTYTYPNSSATGTARVGDKPAFAATAQAVWTLRFALNGAPIAVAGAPAQVTSPVWTTAIPVAEIQSLNI